MTVVIIVIVITASLSIRSSHSSASNNHGSTYPSRDTGLVGYSNKFCDRLTIKGNGDTAEQVMLTLYLLKSMPTVTKQEFITITNRRLDLFDSYEYWFFHLLPKSKIEINACMKGSSSATFYLLKGVNNFADYDNDDYYRYERKIPFSGDCTTKLLSYDVHSNDQYYLIFEKNRGSASFDVSINITQVLYVVLPNIIVNNCSVPLDSDESCNVPVAYSSNYTKALLQLEPKGQLVDWDASNVVHVKCHPRGWLYALICLSAAGGVALIVVLVSAVLFVMHRRGKKKSSRSNDTVEVRSDPPITPSAPEPDNAPLIKPEEPSPPPYNNDYNTLPPYKP